MNRKDRLTLLSIALVPIVMMGLVYGVLALLGIAGEEYSNLLINAGFLAACVGLIWYFKLTLEDIGLKLIRGRLLFHVIAGFLITALYLTFYVYVVKISHLRPFTSQILWGLLNYLVVVFAEEIYYRGMIFGVIQKYFSPKAALVVSSLFFGLMHIRQGLLNVIARTITGWLWGSVRYSTGMIFLLIIPIHFVYNVVWLLYIGNWETPTLWSYCLPALEILLGAGILFMSSRTRHDLSRSE